MKQIIGCGTCKYRPENENKNILMCDLCIAIVVESEFRRIFSQWEDALPCCKTKKAKK